MHLEECAIPVDAVETHETLCWWNIDELSLICEHNVSNAVTSGYQNNLFNSSYLAMRPMATFFTAQTYHWHQHTHSLDHE
jgi:hypothetical protein